MNRTRWLVLAAILAVGFVGASINARGPFDEHPPLAYPQFLADVETGRVDQITRWRDRLEVTQGEQVLLVVVPAGANVAADIDAAATSRGIALDISTVPDEWLISYTPWIAGLLLVGGIVIWVRALLPGKARGQGTAAATR